MFTLDEIKLLPGLIDVALKTLGVKFYETPANPALLQSIVGKLQVAFDEASANEAAKPVEPPKEPE
jgi:hypothetical protein